MAVGRGTVALALLGTAVGWLGGHRLGVYGRAGRGFRHEYAKVAANAVRSAREQESKARALQDEMQAEGDLLLRTHRTVADRERTVREREVEVERSERRLQDAVSWVPSEPAQFGTIGHLYGVPLPEDSALAALLREGRVHTTDDLRQQQRAQAFDGGTVADLVRERRERFGAPIAAAMRAAERLAQEPGSPEWLAEREGRWGVRWGEPKVRVQDEVQEFTETDLQPMLDAIGRTTRDLAAGGRGVHLTNATPSGEWVDLANLPVGVDPTGDAGGMDPAHADLQRRARAPWPAEPMDDATANAVQDMRGAIAALAVLHPSLDEAALREAAGLSDDEPEGDPEPWLEPATWDALQRAGAEPDPGTAERVHLSKMVAEHPRDEAPVEPITEDDVAQAARDLAAVPVEDDERARRVLREAYDGG